MSDDIPTTRRITPAGATEEMIEAGSRVLRSSWVHDAALYAIAAKMWIAMHRARPAPPPMSPWMPIDDAAKTGDDVLLGCRESGFRVVACWDEDIDGWRMIDDCIWAASAFDVWRPLDDLPPIEETFPEPELEIVPAPGVKRRVKVHRPPPPIEE